MTNTNKQWLSNCNVCGRICVIKFCKHCGTYPNKMCLKCHLQARKDISSAKRRFRTLKSEYGQKYWEGQ